MKIDVPFILEDGVSVASDTYWQEPSYFVPSSVCIIIFYHHTVFKINNELQFCWNNPTSRKVFLYHYLPQLPVKCFFHFVREWSICDRLYPSHRTFAKQRYIRLNKGNLQELQLTSSRNSKQNSLRIAHIENCSNHSFSCW